MSMVDQLYRHVIMEHYKNPRNKGLKEEKGYRKLRLKNPSCGDDVTVQVKIENKLLKDVRHDGAGCSICCSAASVMSEVLKNKTVDEADMIIKDFYRLIKGEKTNNPDSLDEAMAYEGVAQFPARVKCATLSWKAMGALLQGSEGEQTDE